MHLPNETVIKYNQLLVGIFSSYWASDEHSIQVTPIRDFVSHTATPSVLTSNGGIVQNILLNYVGKQCIRKITDSSQP